ncbi:MAG: ligase-associated DNA damage response endonuclease PdeM [Phycisphaerae bacterium]|nr:ligase-associated DNA damage response endonuclease PdeM [Phycisphaerae bacterium]
MHHSPVSHATSSAEPVHIELAGEIIRLLPQRAAYWPAARTMLIADLHLGKAESFRARGAPLPAEFILESHLTQLDEALGAEPTCERLLILGDLLHAPTGLTRPLIERVAAWRELRLSLDVALVPGNHDRRLDVVVSTWGLRVLGERFREGPFLFVHQPPGPEDEYIWAGHVHPAVTLRKGCDSVRLPCFHIGPCKAVLPAFSRFTAGASFDRSSGDRIYAIAEHRVFELPGSRGGRTRP